MSIHLQAERNRLLAEIEAIRGTGETAPARCWIDTYQRTSPTFALCDSYVPTNPNSEDSHGQATSSLLPAAD